MNIDILNAHCGLGTVLGPRLSQGRLTINLDPFEEALVSEKKRSGVGRSKCIAVSAFSCRSAAALRRLKCRQVLVSTTSSGSARKLLELKQSRLLARDTILRGRREDSLMEGKSPVCSFVLARQPTRAIVLRPEIRRDYPLNLSISISGGKETNKDSPSNGERSGNSPAPNPSHLMRRDLWC